MKNLILTILFIIPAFVLFSQTAEQSNDINTFFDASKFPNGIKTIIVYGKKDCDRCVIFNKQMNEYNIPFKDLDLNDGNIFSEMDQKVYKALPHKGLGYSLSFPVVEVDGIMFFNLANHGEFATDLHNHWKKFN